MNRNLIGAASRTSVARNQELAMLSGATIYSTEITSKGYRLSDGATATAVISGSMWLATP